MILRIYDELYGLPGSPYNLVFTDSVYIPKLNLSGFKLSEFGDDSYGDVTSFIVSY